MSPNSIARNVVRSAIWPERAGDIKREFAVGGGYNLQGSAEAVQRLQGAADPPTERGHDVHLRHQQGDAEEQDGDVAQKDDHGGEEVTLVADVGLGVPKDVPGEGDVKGVGRAEQEMKPNEVVTPVPKPVSGEKDQHHEHGIEREEIRSQRDGEVALAHHDVTAAGGGPEASDSAAEEPGPKGMGKLVAEDIDPHWLWEQKVDDQPTSRTRKERHPGGIGVPSGLQDHP